MRRSQKSTVSGVLSHITRSSPPYDKTSRNCNNQQASNQVFRFPVQKHHVCAVVFLCLIVSSCVAYPRIEAQKGRKPGAVYFKTVYCRSLSGEELQKRMGTYYDNSKMAQDADTLKLGQHAGAVQGRDLSDEEEMENLQGDDPDAYSDDIFSEDEEDDEEEDYVDEEESEKAGYKDKTQVYRYMRKRRGVQEDKETPHRGSILTKRGSSNDFNTLHLKLALSGRKNSGHRSHDGKSRKQLKKELREKVRKSNKDPPWECKMEPAYKKMRDGIFPRYVTDGRCVTDKCFFRIYNCVPKKYRIRLLERDPDRCNPLPDISANTTYEERWYFRNYFVTVGCNCERRKQKKRNRH